MSMSWLWILIGVVAAVAFVALAIAWYLSTGWHELEEHYATRESRPQGKSADWQFLGTDFSGHEASLTTTSVGVYADCPLFWRPTSKPLFIPWSDLSDAEAVPLMPNHVRFKLAKGGDHVVLPRAVVAGEPAAANLLASIAES